MREGKKMTLQQVRQIEPDATRVENYKDLVIYWTGQEIHTMKQNGDDAHVSDATLRNALRAIRNRATRSLMEDSGYSRSEAVALVDAGF